MGVCSSRCPSARRIPIKVAVVGLDNAGKSSVVNQIMGDYHGLVTPTLGFASVAARSGNVVMTVFDLGGSALIRPYWTNYYHEVGARPAHRGAGPALS